MAEAAAGARRRSLRAAALVVLALACGEDAPRSEPAADRPRARVVGAVLYLEDSGELRPLLTLDSTVQAPRPPEFWEPAPGSRFGIAASGFRHAMLSPDGEWVAWEVSGVHDLLGLTPAGGGPPRVLDFYFGSSAAELAWSPEGRYLAALYGAPSGLTELRVYDAAASRRLETPWGRECRARERCQVVAYEWAGPGRLRVRTAVPGGQSRQYGLDLAKRAGPARPVS